MNAPQLRLLPVPSPSDLWVAAVRREIEPSTLTLLTRAVSAPGPVSALASVDAWIAALRREDAA
jgi:hypothetical protein